MTKLLDVVATGEGRSLGFIPAVDGLRAVAIAMVIAHHVVVPDSRFFGGRGGVDLFFVISGFLITALIVNEYDRTDGVSLKNFYRRRAYRLLPAFAVMLAVTMGYVLLTSVKDHHGIPEVGIKGALYAIFYATNWGWALGVALPGYLIHLWSLAAEEQFYFVAPLALAFVLPRLARRHVALAFGAVAALSVVWRWFLFAQGEGHNRLQFGLDTHADSLLIGAMLGVAYASGLAKRVFASTKSKEVLGVASLVGLLLITVVDHGRWAGVNFWSPLVYGVVGAGAVISVVGQDTGSHIQLLRLPALRRVGKLAYALYLWHVPIMYLAARAFPDVSLVVRGPVTIALSYAAAEASWRLVEMPAQRIRDKRAAEAAGSPVRGEVVLQKFA